MSTIIVHGIYDGKVVRILPGETPPPTHGETSVTVVFEGVGEDPTSALASLIEDESPDAIAVDEARWEAQFADSADKLGAMAREALAQFLAGATTEIEIVDGELKPAGEND